MKAFKVRNLKCGSVNVIIHENVVPGSMLMTDEFPGYRNIGKDLYPVEAVNHGSGEYVCGAVHTNTIEPTWSQFKRGVVGIYHHISSQHLQRYLDEFMIRANSRSMSEHKRVNEFLSSVAGLRFTYSDLIS